jgi:PelA/Pel-15E family pectate lyase
MRYARANVTEPPGTCYSTIMSRLFYAVFALSLASAFADPITTNRLNELPSADQPAWRAYLERSIANAKLDAAAVQAEVIAHKMTNAVRAPSGGDFGLPAKNGAPWYTTDNAKQLADTILSYQTPSGGWSKHLGFSKGPRQPGMQWSSQNEPGQPAHYVATFDNRSTTEEMYFLANMWEATKRDDCKAGFTNGLKFILAAQFPNGGWPQVYPLEGGYHDDITFNDDAMTHILELLAAIGRNEPCYAFLNDSQRRQAADALGAGIRNVLKTQITQNGKKTVWCAQYDSITLQPVGARKMEPGTLSGSESAHILEFLMTITNPAPEIVASIENGLAWFESVKITGLSKTNVNGKTAYESNSDSTTVYWARFYDLATGKPVFPGRDGIVYQTFAEMAAKNKLGYDYYTTHPGSTLNNHQKKWRKMLAASTTTNASPNRRN